MFNCNNNKSAVPDDKLFVKGSKPSIPNKVSRGSIVSGVPYVWFEWIAFLLEIIFYITTGSSIIFISKFLFFYLQKHIINNNTEIKVEILFKLASTSPLTIQKEKQFNKIDNTTTHIMLKVENTINSDKYQETWSLELHNTVCTVSIWKATLT